MGKTTIEGELIGKISHYFAKIGVAAIELTGELKVGDKIRVKGGTTNFEHEINSMQIEMKPVSSAGSGDSVGIKVSEKVRTGDQVYKI